MIRLRCELPINNYWQGFLPIEKKDWLKFRISFEDDNINVIMGIRNIKENLDVISDPQENIEKSYIPGKNLTIVIEANFDSNIENLILDLDKKKYNEILKTDNKILSSFLKKSEKMITNIYNEVYGLIRNQFYQYWIHFDNYLTNNYLQTAKWKNSHDKWINIFPAVISLSSRIRIDGLKKNDWNELEDMLNTNKKYSLHTFLISNARASMDAQNYRIAIIEIVTALESVLKMHLSKLLPETVFAYLDEVKVDKAIDKIGLRLSSELFLQYLGNKYKFDKQIVKNCLDGIITRNNIIHQNQKKVNAEKTRKIIESITIIVKKIIVEVKEMENRT